MAYISAAQPILPNKTLAARLIATGADPKFVESITLRVFHYRSANQTPLIELKEVTAAAGDIMLAMAMKIHDYTNMATAYEGYNALIKEMWDTLFQAAGLVERTFRDLYRECPDRERLESAIQAMEHATPGLMLENFLKDPRLLTPHFLLAESPTSKHVQKVETLLNSMAGQRR